MQRNYRPWQQGFSGRRVGGWLARLASLPPPALPDHPQSRAEKPLMPTCPGVTHTNGRENSVSGATTLQHASLNLSLFDALEAPNCVKLSLNMWTATDGGHGCFKNKSTFRHVPLMTQVDLTPFNTIFKYHFFLNKTHYYEQLFVRANNHIFETILNQTFTVFICKSMNNIFIRNLKFRRSRHLHRHWHETVCRLECFVNSIITA